MISIIGILIASGIIIYLVLLQIYPAIEEAGSFEQAYAIQGISFIVWAIIIFSSFGSIIRLFRRIQRLKENPFFEDSYSTSSYSPSTLNRNDL